MHRMTKSAAQMIVQIAVLALLLINLINYKGARRDQEDTTGTSAGRPAHG